jgi:hypothetical protein
MAGVQRGGVFDTFGNRFVSGNRLQGIGDPGQRRDHHQHLCALGAAFADARADLTPARPGRDAGAAELENDPAASAGALLITHGFPTVRPERGLRCTAA